MAQNPIVTITMEDGGVMKAEFGSIALAIDNTPAVCFKSFWKPLCENSPLIEYPGPPVPLPDGHPP